MRFQVVESATSFLRETLFARGKAESTTEQYARYLARFVNFLVARRWLWLLRHRREPPGPRGRGGRALHADRGRHIRRGQRCARRDARTTRRRRFADPAG